MIRRRLIWASLTAWAVVTLLGVMAQGASISLAWDLSPDPTVIGYRVWYGTAKTSYSAYVDVGPTNYGTVNQLSSGKSYYLTVAAYDAGGDFSSNANQLQYTTPTPPGIAATKVVNYTTTNVSVGAGASITVAPGANVNFAPVISGTGPLSYQWQFGKANLPSATKATLLLTNVTAANAGAYLIVVSNVAGTMTSSPMTLVVMPLLAGSYNGLFYQTNKPGSTNVATNICVDTGGLLANCVIGTQGAYSGRLYVDNNGYSFSGTLDVYGNAGTTIFRGATAQSNLYVRLNLNSALAAGQLTGTVSNMDKTNPWSAPLAADAAGPGSLLGLGGANLICSSPNFPEGGEATFTSLLGQVTLLAELPDGTLLTETSPVSTVFRMPVYASLYNGFGVLEGWLSLSNNIPKGTLTWVQEANAPGSSYPAGFTNVLVATNSP